MTYIVKIYMCGNTLTQALHVHLVADLGGGGCGQTDLYNSGPSFVRLWNICVPNFCYAITAICIDLQIGHIY